MPVRDLVGLKFNRLLVLSRAENEKHSGNTRWNCLCDCGNKTVTSGTNLTRGISKSCGCGGKRIVIGSRYGRLVILEKVDKPKEVKRTAYYYKTLCDCGNFHITSSVDLRQGTTQSCGCLRKEKAFKATFKDIAGKKFGKLTAVKVVGSDDGTVWLTKCECGNERTVSKSNLISGAIQSCKDCIVSQLDNLTGKKFGKLTVIDRGESRHKQTTWNCHCDCGAKVNIIASNLKRGLSQSCGCVRSRGEEFISKILLDNNISFTKEYKFDDLKGIGGKKLQFDFAIMQDNKLSHLIEFDGVQHFDKENFFYTDTLLENDRLKDEYCKKNNIRLIRLRSYNNLTIEDLL
jgi:hypothetical protein